MYYVWYRVPDDKIDGTARAGVMQHINLIAKIESHYTRMNSKRHYIDGSKTIFDLYRD